MQTRVVLKKISRKFLYFIILFLTKSFEKPFQSKTFPPPLPKYLHVKTVCFKRIHNSKYLPLHKIGFIHTFYNEDFKTG